MDSFMLDNFSFILILLIVFLACYMYLNKPKNTLPGPKGLPFIGSPKFFKAKNERKSHMVLAAGKAYGDIFSINIGWYNFVFVNGYDNIHELFVKRSAEFSDRPSFLVPEAVKEGKGILDVICG